MASFHANNPITLLNNATSSGSLQAWRGGRGFITIEGTWSGATATLQWKSANDTLITLDSTNLQWTANGAGLFEAPPGQIQMTISGSPTAMYAYAYSTDAP